MKQFVWRTRKIRLLLSVKLLLYTFSVVERTRRQACDTYCVALSSTTYDFAPAGAETPYLEYSGRGNAAEAWANDDPRQILRTATILVAAAAGTQAQAVFWAYPNMTIATPQRAVRTTASTNRIRVVSFDAADPSCMVVGRARGRKRRVCRRMVIFSSYTFRSLSPILRFFRVLWPPGSLLELVLSLGVRFPRRTHHAVALQDGNAVDRRRSPERFFWAGGTPVLLHTLQLGQSRETRDVGGMPCRKCDHRE